VARRIAFVAAAAVFFAALVYTTTREAAVECEVCMEFGGASACRTGRGGDQESAVSGAVTAACAALSNGVTSGMACDRTPPRSVRCDE
jgi:hypothetical protein